MKEDFEKTKILLDNYKARIVKTLSDMIAIKSISPESGGDGESKRVDFLQEIIKGWGIKADRYDYKDKTGTTRSNLVCKLGKNPGTLWIICHVDTVSEGDASFWKTGPFVAQVKDGKIYGRGSTDNGQGVVSAIFTLKALIDSNARLKSNLGIALVADEELGNTYGIKKLLNEGIFKKGDMVLVPDYGTSKGEDVEIAEKSMLWLKLTVKGKQVHASVPNTGQNAYRFAIKILDSIDIDLHKKYNKKDPLYDPDISTFEMTKHEKNVDSVNIIPGTDVSYIDCRVLPEYSLNDVIKDVKLAISEFPGVYVEVEAVIRNDAPKPTDKNSDIAKELLNALRELRKIKPKLVGIGGGTCASLFRELDIPAIAWSTQEPIAHQPNEYAVIDNIIDDAKVFAYMCIY